jgi:hypothetical protein
MNTLTVPKIRDLVNKPNEQYKDIYATLQKSVQGQGQRVATASATANNMTEELTQFLNDLKKTSSQPQHLINSDSTPIGELPTSNGYSAY